MAPVRLNLPDAVGYGSMSLTWRPSPLPLDEAVTVLNYVTKKYGVRSINGGEFYGPDNLNLKLLKKFLESNEPDFNRQLVICIKGAMDIAKGKPAGSDEGVKKSVENVLSFFPADIGRPKLIFEAARVDPEVPYEATIASISEYVKKGLLDGISVSEVGIHSIAKADDVYPITSVEVELSLLTRDILFNGVLKECSERNIPIVAYSPLHRAVLTDHTVENGDKFLASLPEGDLRRHLDRFSRENFDANFVLVQELYEFAHKKGMSLENLALSWILKLSGRENFDGIKKVCKIIPIPSGSSTSKIDKNFTRAAELSDKEFEEINSICDKRKIQGRRYNVHHAPLEFA